MHVAARGRGRPHHEAFKFMVQSEAPMITKLMKLHEKLIYWSSLEFALGNLDRLREKEDEGSSSFKKLVD